MNEIEICTKRAIIETNLDRCRDSIANNLVEIGRWLNEAKASGVVKHGDWQAWASEHSGLNERGCQRAMKAARELQPGSPIAQLGATKIMAILSLPEPEREEFAQRIDAAHATSREVEEAVKAARAERDEALRVVGEQKKRMIAMEQDKNEAVRCAINKANREANDEARRLNGLLESANIGQKRTNKLYGEALERIEAMRKEGEQLRKELQEAKEKNSPDDETQRRVEQLEQTIAQQAETIRARDKELDALSDQLDEMETASRRGDRGPVRDPSTVILSAIGALFAEAGKAPGELSRLASPMNEETRRLLVQQAQSIGQWAMAIIAACGGDAI